MVIGALDPHPLDRHVPSFPLRILRDGNNVK